MLWEEWQTLEGKGLSANGRAPGRAAVGSGRRLASRGAVFFLLHCGGPAEKMKTRG